MSFSGEYNAGETVRIEEQFVNLDGSPAAATDVSLTITHQDGTILEPLAAMAVVAGTTNFFFYDFIIPSGTPEGTVDVRVSGKIDGLECTGHEQFVISHIKERVKELRLGNQRILFYPAIAVNVVRKTAIGVLDRETIETKLDSDPDWSSPTSSHTLYFWYADEGDINPIKVGENG